MVVGYGVCHDGKTTDLLVWNSWGADWGEYGFAWVRVGYSSATMGFDQYSYEFSLQRVE